jgi:hypothetical protein
MNVTLRQPMTVAQFLAWEERQVGIEIPLADIYGDVAFAPETGEPA